MKFPFKKALRNILLFWYAKKAKSKQYRGIYSVRGKNFETETLANMFLRSDPDE